MKLGVCYYPEHWPREMWADDARRMVELGLSWVRIGEFAWSRIEPEPGRFDWAWLDEAVETLGAAGLKLVMGTPTATPPKWLIDAHPDILAWDMDGRPRRFGSRRHYSFSSETYGRQSARIVEALAARYGEHPAIGAWQTDNEYGCHDTTLDYSPNAQTAFRRWLAARYGTVEAMNAAWGAVFWSQDYPSFEAVDLPNLTVTEPHPGLHLDFRRFASDEVARFNRIQTDILRARSPGRDITHNFMGFTTSFDHGEVAKDLDLSSWDSYPLGFLESFWFSEAEKRRYLRQGHPDVAAFHHDLYRGVGRGRFWVMEQQPGPVNWARYNPAPLPGMVRTWSWEALAHGAETVSYFRWRQAPFAQEQMHAGLNRPDNILDRGGEEAAEVAREIARLGPLPSAAKAKVALVFSYEADWRIAIQPHGAAFRHLEIVFETYGALRRLGLDVDMVSPADDLAGYALVVAPCLPYLETPFLIRLAASGARVLFGPRAGSRDVSGKIPAELPPGPLQARLKLKVARVESLRPGVETAVRLGETTFQARLWREDLETRLPARATYANGEPAWVEDEGWSYLGFWPEADLLDRILTDLAREAGLETTPLAEGVRLRRRGDLTFAFNFAPEPRAAPAPAQATFVLGDAVLPPGGLAAWRA
ncbi:MAG: beta-galactosidase [Alphaproteobacteria bacterium]|nr:beta-galactosidase [Alphaproteobacteria bacterium]